MHDFLFVGGCARSGTSPLAGLLGAHPAICIGMERYIRVLLTRKEAFGPELFTKQRFFNVQDGDTFYGTLEGKPHYNGMEGKWDKSRYIGDKIPRIYAHYPHIGQKFPSAKMVFITRNLFDVATSFKRRAADETDTWSRERGVTKAIVEWNTAHRKTLKHFDGNNIFVVQFEAILEDVSLAPLLEFLGLSMTDEVKAECDAIRKRGKMATKKRSSSGDDGKLSPAEKLAVMRDGDLVAYKKLVTLAGSAGRLVSI
jgi:hypothetical protein